MFRYRLLCDAYASEASRDCTDDAQAVEALAATGRCAMPRLVIGSAQNVKVTYPADLALAAAIIAVQERS
jgi:2-C-methyl-D-erythritol 4-phosphate cytidylyltransferase